jgi:signal transduction histidine kinase
VGLGLAIARWAVEANGGRIEIESEEGQGSLFRIVLPWVETDGGKRTVASPSGPPTEGPQAATSQ